MINETNNVPRPHTVPENSLASEIRNRPLFESARHGIIILEADSLKIFDVNPFMLEFLGYSPDEFLGKELWEIGLFKDKDESQIAFRELQESGCICYEDLALETKTGISHEVGFISSVYSEGSRQVVLCNIRDLTERKREEVALREQADMLAGWHSL